MVEVLREWCARLCIAGLQITMTEWQSEDEIKAQLRELTEETRKVREDLDALVRPPTTSPTRAFIHKQAGPKAAKPAVVNDRRQRKKSKDTP
jgi:Asp-tRNA(Asn)/Glu-tRNA(Gln) amidotransferase A subunit family amidase